MTLVIAAGWLAGWLLLWRLPTLGRPETARRDHRISVVIPARNEEDRLPILLASLATQTRPPDEVVVVDDHSRDDTAAVARSFSGVRVVAAPPVPLKWTGKCWACETGVRATDGDLLVFLDADVELSSGALASLATTWETSGGLLSVQPHHRIARRVEAASLPFNVIALMGLGIGSVWKPRRGWGAAGPCMATDRETYQDVGGHRAVREAVAEDLALADRYSAAGHEVRCLAGGRHVRFRMYRNLRGVFQGWSKNIATGARHTPLLRALGIVLWMAALITAAATVAGSMTGSLAGVTTAAGLYAMVAVQVGMLGHQVGQFGLAALLWPLLLGFFLVVFVWSVGWTFVARRVRWSDRTVHLGRASTRS